MKDDAHALDSVSHDALLFLVRLRDGGQQLRHTAALATEDGRRDLWEHKELGVFENSFTAKALPGHTSMMVKLIPVVADL